jgi:hypothetical protein
MPPEGVPWSRNMPINKWTVALNMKERHERFFAEHCGRPENNNVEMLPTTDQLDESTEVTKNNNVEMLPATDEQEKSNEMTETNTDVDMLPSSTNEQDESTELNMNNKDVAQEGAIGGDDDESDEVYFCGNTHDNYLEFFAEGNAGYAAKKYALHNKKCMTCNLRFSNEVRQTTKGKYNNSTFEIPLH